MFGDMNRAVVSLIYKDKGALDHLDNYRPITVLTATYKILSRTIALATYQHIHHVVSLGQCGFQPHKATNHSSDLTQDMNLANLI